MSLNRPCQTSDQKFLISLIRNAVWKSLQTGGDPSFMILCYRTCNINISCISTHLWCNLIWTMLLWSSTWSLDTCWSSVHACVCNEYQPHPSIGDTTSFEPYHQTSIWTLFQESIPKFPTAHLDGPLFMHQSYQSMSSSVSFERRLVLVLNKFQAGFIRPQLQPYHSDHRLDPRPQPQAATEVPSSSQLLTDPSTKASSSQETKPKVQRSESRFLGLFCLFVCLKLK